MKALIETGKAEVIATAESLEEIIERFINCLDAKPTTANTYKKPLNSL